MIPLAILIALVIIGGGALMLGSLYIAITALRAAGRLEKREAETRSILADVLLSLDDKRLIGDIRALQDRTPGPASHLIQQSTRRRL